ncbi:protein PIF-like [Haliotis asinina]|uniref:protein PIF-like n=1 Tax=Haliotis asinina TaxID=109174 RepID=UPI003531CED0
MLRLWRVFCFLVVMSAKVTFSQTCGGFSDIIFLIDDSDSTKRNNPTDPDSVTYAQGVTSFVQHFVDKADLSNIRIAVIAYSKTTRVITDFTSNSSTITNALNTFQPEFKGSDILEGMKLVKDMFQSSGRLGARHLVVIVTDGSTFNPDLAGNYAKRCQDAGIEITSVAFGDAISFQELMLYSNSSDRIFKVTNDTELSALTPNVTEIICGDPCEGPLSLVEEPGLFRYPGNCAKFLQVAPANQTGLECVSKDCSYTTMWNDRLKICDYPGSATCDPCRGQADGRRTSYHLYCNSYWECQGGVSQPRCCGSGKKYVEGTGCVAAGVSECPNPCPS